MSRSYAVYRRRPAPSRSLITAPGERVCTLQQSGIVLLLCEKMSGFLVLVLVISAFTCCSLTTLALSVSNVTLVCCFFFLFNLLLRFLVQIGQLTGTKGFFDTSATFGVNGTDLGIPILIPNSPVGPALAFVFGDTFGKYCSDSSSVTFSFSNTAYHHFKVFILCRVGWISNCLAYVPTGTSSCVWLYFFLFFFSTL